MHFLRKSTAVFLAAALLSSPGAAGAETLPVNGPVTSGIGWRPDPFGSGRMVFHRGVDISVPTGTPVHPTQEGYVFFAGPYGDYGILVAVAHGDGYLTLYGHNSEAKVRVGEWVKPADVIALSGNSGKSTGPHVHYEVRRHQGKDREQQEQVVKAMRENLGRSLPAAGVAGS